MDTTTNYTVPPLGRRLGAGISYLILSIIGTTVNFLVAYALYKHRKFYLRYPFYFFICHLLAASLGIFLGQFMVVIPLSLTGKPLYGDGGLMIAVASLDTLFFMTMFFISLFIAINRFVAVFSRRLHWLFFEDFRLYISSAIPWTLGIFWVAFTTAIGCPKVFLHNVFYYTYRCPNPMETTEQKVFMGITTHLGYIGPAIMMLLYLSVIIYIRSTKSKTASHSSELKLILQAILMCSSFEIETLCFTFLPDLTPDWGIYIISLLLDYALIINASISPIIMICMNSKIRRTIAKLFGRSPEQDENSLASNQKVFEVSSTDMLRVYSADESAATRF